MAQKLRSDLSKAGYTDITVAPSGFMARAKDSQGNPVMMMISPDSVTAITEENAASNANHNNRNNTGSQPAQPNATKPQTNQPKPIPAAPGSSRISRESATAAWRCLTASR